MTKTIKNITPRAVGDTFDVAYLSDLSALNSGLSADIDTLRQVIGGSDWELSSTIFFDENYIKGDLCLYSAIISLDDNIDTELGYYTAAYYIDSTKSIKENISLLDEYISQALTGVYKINGGLGTQFDSETGAVTFSGSYVGGATTYGEAIETLDSQMNMAWNAIEQNNNSIVYNSQSIETLNTDLENLAGRVGDVADGDGWDSTHYISATSNLTDAAVVLDEVIYNTQTAGVVTLSARATAETGYASTYDLHQGGVLKGSINIPKDFLVKSAALSTVTTADVPYTGAKVGDKYIDFVINAKDASATAEHIYLPVNDLVDVYTAQQNATQVQLAIDNNNVISATIVDSSVTTVKIADGAVTTAKIADGAVNTNKIRLIDTATTGQYAGKAYTLQVTNGRLQVKELPSQPTI